MRPITPSWTSSMILAMAFGPKLGQAALDVDLEDDESIKKAMNTTAAQMLSYYTGYEPGDVAGNLPPPYYWWECGAMFGALVEYWYYTGDTTYNDWTYQAIVHQQGDRHDYNPSNQSRAMGNDDQIFWGFTVMAAAEYNFQNPPEGEAQWVALAENLFDQQVARWDTKACNGGLRWQVYPFSAGYNYKNTISQAGLFNVATRLAKWYGSKNETFAKWADTIWDWTEGVGLMTKDHIFYDGAYRDDNCTKIPNEQHMYVPALFLHGAANMYNLTGGSDKWGDRVDGVVRGLYKTYFPNHDGVMAEPCEARGKCTTDMKSFKAFLARFSAAAIPLAPRIEQNVTYFLNASAKAAVKQCSGPDNACGLRWTEGGKYTGQTGLGEAMSVMEILKALLVKTVEAPKTGSTGGTSKGNDDGGSGVAPPVDPEKDPRTKTIAAGDKAGGAILTILAVLGPIGAAVWICELL